MQKQHEPSFKTLRRVITGLRLFPKTHDFFSYYERSIENTVEGAALLCQMIKEKDRRHELAKQIKDHEHIGDKITHDVIDLLRDTFLTPFDRSDMHHLIVKLDDVLDIINYIGNRLSRYNIGEMPKEVEHLGKIVLESTQELAKAMRMLRNMKHSQQVIDHCIEVNRLENAADDDINHVIEELFSDKKWDALQVIKIKEIVENLESATDKCEDVANVIEGIILKHT